MSRIKKTNFSDKQAVSPLLIGDSLQNVVAKLGTQRDKASHTVYCPEFLSSHDLMDMYRSSWLAAAIVDYPAEDATRNWRQWRADKDQITKIETIEKRLKLRAKVQEALKAARLYGGSAIYINTDSADQSSALRQNENIDSLIVLSKDSLMADAIVKDIRSEYYGRPEYYTITSNDQSVTIHASRFAIFSGDDVPATHTLLTSAAWGDSVLQKTIDAIRSTDSTMANIASLVFEAKIDVLQFENLTQALKEKNGSVVATRLALQMAMKGNNGAVILDTKDTYNQKTYNFSGIPDVARLFHEFVAGASRVPGTRLFGRSSAGLSGNGDGDERVYYDRVGDMQSNDIAPAIALIDDCIINEALGSRPANIYYDWAPLRQKTEVERADILGKIATAARSLAGTSAGEVIPLDALSDAVINTLIESGSLAGLEQAVAKFGSLGEQVLSREEDNDQV